MAGRARGGAAAGGEDGKVVVPQCLHQGLTRLPVDVRGHALAVGDIELCHGGGLRHGWFNSFTGPRRRVRGRPPRA
ncbi:hypothetical protein ACFFX0_20175 [Citricoccus parietis]|uniref:Uncharacterized protein n=1 Tax=Citricoccus parietis TaxID=592307 RepID=A0ABV5G389_9MICC